MRLKIRLLETTNRCNHDLTLEILIDLGQTLDRCLKRLGVARKVASPNVVYL